MIVSNRLFHEFEKAFADEIINPCDLIIKEQIGKGKYLFIQLEHNKYIIMIIDVILSTYS